MCTHHPILTLIIIIIAIIIINVRNIIQLMLPVVELLLLQVHYSFCRKQSSPNKRMVEAQFKLLVDGTMMMVKITLYQVLASQQDQAKLVNYWQEVLDEDQQQTELRRAVVTDNGHCTIRCLTGY